MRSREGGSPRVLCQSELHQREEEGEGEEGEGEEEEEVGALEVIRLEREKMQELTEDVSRYGERNRKPSERNDVGRRVCGGDWKRQEKVLGNRWRELQW